MRRYFTQCRAGTFIGDISMFTGEPTLGDLLLRTTVVRREWLKGRATATSG
jgi:hypothetical protein